MTDITPEPLVEEVDPDEADPSDITEVEPNPYVDGQEDEDTGEDLA